MIGIQLRTLILWKMEHRVFKAMNITHFPALLSLYEDSHVKLLQKVFPDYDWKVWKFEHVPNKYWQSKENQKVFFEE